MIVRYLTEKIVYDVEAGKVIIVYGPRRVGKTTILKKIEQEYSARVNYVDGEDRVVQKALSTGTVRSLEQFLGETELLIIDEAQKIPDIGTNLKLIVDHFPQMKVIVSGSASFALAQEVGEPLTGRKKTQHLYPLSLSELIDYYGMENMDSLTKNHLMVYGGYPETFCLSDAEKEEYLKELTQSYLFRDILEIENIRNTNKLRDLLVLLAFQIGSEVSLSELGNKLDIHKDTVFRYLDMLEKSFVIINIRGFSRNLRKEVTKTSRYYFYDNGVRNALINNFNPISLRDDIGALWENFLVMERLKKQSRERMNTNNYFWRTYDQQEIDWVEEQGGRLYGFEFKWNISKARKRAPKSWTDNYSNASFQNITQENYRVFVT